MNKYSTKQKKEIIDVISLQKKDFSIKDIHNILGNKVGVTTIYRTINELISCGKLDKVVKENNCAYYRYLETCDKDNHFYLRCDNCGEMEHIDCECIKKLSGHIFKSHDFVINSKKTILSGVCKKCRKGELNESSK